MVEGSAGHTDNRCPVCKSADPTCRCLISARMLDEAALEIVARDEDGDVTDSWLVVVNDDGRLALANPENLDG